MRDKKSCKVSAESTTKSPKKRNFVFVYPRNQWPDSFLRLFKLSRTAKQQNSFSDAERVYSSNKNRFHCSSVVTTLLLFILIQFSWKTILHVFFFLFCLLISLCVREIFLQLWYGNVKKSSKPRSLKLDYKLNLAACHVFHHAIQFDIFVFHANQLN